MSDALALKVGEFLVRAILSYDRDEVIAVRPFLAPLGRERHCAGEIDSEAGRPGREASDMQAARAHGFDLGRVRLHGVIDHALTGALREKVGERFEHILIDGRIFNRRVGKNQR